MGKRASDGSQRSSPLATVFFKSCRMDDDTEAELGITARAKVLRVIDGDTVDVELRLPVRIRLRDCWAPELRGEERDAGQRAKRELAAILPRGRRVVVTIPTQSARQLGDVLTFGRVLGHIWAKISGSRKSIAAEMVDRGHATRERPQ